MGIVRTTIAVGMMGLSFYGGYKAHDVMKPCRPYVQQASLEDSIKVVLEADRDKVKSALERIGRQYNLEP